MSVLRTIVLLAGWTAGQQLELKGDKAWYEQYLFDPAHGQASYWAKQSDNDVILEGQVVDWVFFKDQNPALADREGVANFVIRAAEADTSIHFIAYDLVIVVLGIPDTVPSDGGSCTARSRSRTHAAVVTRVNDRFDFVEHEIGHALGLQHSYGAWSYKAVPWSQPGEYGHPYCVMSATVYGGGSGAYVPAVPRDNRKEYSGLGPSLNAATALARGWVDAYEFGLPGARPAEITLRSRHWGGRNPHLAPQALNVVADDGQNYVVEYREADGWDQAQGTPALIVNHGRGSTADAAHPGTDSATFLRALRLPITFGGIGSTYQGPGFGLQMLDRSTAHHTVTFRIHPGVPAPLTYLDLTAAIGVVEETVLETGETSFEPGERICVEGVWPYRKLTLAQVATFEATYGLAVPPISAAWTVDDQVLAAPGGVITLAKEVTIADATLDEIPSGQSVRLRYEIEPLPAGSRLRLFNRPEDESFSVRLGVTLTTDLGSGTADDTARFVGIRYAYPPEFYARRNACIVDFGRTADRYLRYKALLPPDVWRTVPQERFVEIKEFLDALGHLRGLEDQRPYRQALPVLRELIDVAPAEIAVVERDDVVETARPENQPELLDFRSARGDDVG
jgi:Metallo-peptidase family M12B Reprolysin-like